MTNTFKNASVDPVLATATVIYTCPAATQAVVHNIHLANIDVALGVTATIELFDSSAAANKILGRNIPISVGSALDFEKPINLEVGDQIIVTANAVNSVSAVLSILEIS